MNVWAWHLEQPSESLNFYGDALGRCLCLSEMKMSGLTGKCLTDECVRTQYPYLAVGGDVAQLLEHRTGTPLVQVQFPGAARDFFPQSQLSAQTLSWCPYSPVCSCMHENLCARERSCSVCHSSMDYETPKQPLFNAGWVV